VKTAHDPRHEKRIQTVQELFSFSFDPEQRTGTIEEVVEKLPDIDTRIREFASERPLADINKLDLAILRLGVFELVYQKMNPAITIDEAIEIAKEFGGDSSPKFVNAVLGKIAESL